MDIYNDRSRALRPAPPPDWAAEFNAATSQAQLDAIRNTLNAVQSSMTPGEFKSFMDIYNDRSRALRPAPPPKVVDWAAEFNAATSQAQLDAIRNTLNAVQSSMTPGEFKSFMDIYNDRSRALRPAPPPGPGGSGGDLSGGGGPIGGGLGSISPEHMQFLDKPEFYQGLFDKEYGIPDVGRSPYQQWFSEQAQNVANEYVLRQMGLQGGMELGVDDLPITFSQFMTDRGTAGISSLGGGFLEELGGMGTERLTAFFEALGLDNRSRLGQAVFQGGLETLYPSFIAEGLTRQAFSSPVQEAFDISPERLDLQDPSNYLNYLMTRYKVGG